MSEHDWGGGEWWQEWPPPPGADGDDYYDSFNDDAGEGWEESHLIPPEPDLPQPSYEDNFGLSEQIYDAWDFLTSLDMIDPQNVRGVGFSTIYEAVSWLEAIGVLSFSQVIYMDGLYYPVIGESEIEDGGPDDFGYGGDGGLPF